MENPNQQINERVTCGSCSYDPNNKDHVIGALNEVIEHYRLQAQELRNDIEVLKAIKEPSYSYLSIGFLTDEIKQLKDYIQTLELAEFYRSEK